LCSFLITFELNKMVQQANDIHFMKAALDEANKAFDKQEVPVGAVIVCNDVIIARAHNLTETLKDPTAHAEMQAITAATNYLGGKYLTDCKIYVTVEPCPMCAGALNEKRGYSKISAGLLHNKTRIKKGVLENDCRELMVRFFKSKR
jgi:tRNA(adenine34) deaminase